jgi:hypothetical protein
MQTQANSFELKDLANLFAYVYFTLFLVHKSNTTPVCDV